MGEADFTPVRFSSGELPEAERIPVWREFFGRLVFRTEIEPMPDVRFHADVRVRRVPGVAVVSGVMSPVRLSRTRDLVADGDDDIMVFVSSSGGTVFHRAGEFEYAAGEAVVRTAAQPMTLLIPSAARFRCVHIRQAALAPFVAEIDDAARRPVPQDSEALRYLLRYVAFLEQDRTPAGPVVAGSVTTHLIDLVALVLGASRDASAVAHERGLRAARLSAIKADIVDYLTRPDLTVSTVAVRHGITPRYVQLLFEGDGTTFSEFVLQKRLEWVHRLLTTPRFARHSISGLAIEAGFGDISYFNRAFRQRYGLTPSDVREQGSIQ